MNASFAPPSASLRDRPGDRASVRDTEDEASLSSKAGTRGSLVESAREPQGAEAEDGPRDRVQHIVVGGGEDDERHERRIARREGAGDRRLARRGDSRSRTTA